jgi:hypothetical protein
MCMKESSNPVSTSRLLFSLLISSGSDDGSVEPEPPFGPAQPHGAVQPHAERPGEREHPPRGHGAHVRQERRRHGAHGDERRQPKRHAVGALEVGLAGAQPEERRVLEQRAEAVEEVGGGDDVVEAEEGDGEGHDGGGGDGDVRGAEAGGAPGEHCREEAQLGHAQQLEHAAAQLGLEHADG